MNIAIYGCSANRWAMTERRADALDQTAASLRIGPSWMSWDGKALDLWVDEIGCPRPHRLRGRIRITEGALTQQSFVIDQRGRHTWQPLLTSARLDVDLQHPSLRWSGSGYVDTNFGSEPLGAAFRRWNWARTSISGGTVVQYDVVPRSGDEHSLTVMLDRDGMPKHADLPLKRQLPPTTIWRIARSARADHSGTMDVVRTLEDTPFYSRSLLAADIMGERTAIVHESLDMDRFANPLVKFMLAFRMPRRWI
jgi:carotenoid 1,2-hydratase